MKKIISLLLCTTLLCACFEDVGTDNKGSIAGTVLDYTLGDPIPVVNVVLKEGNISTVTGYDGTFWFNNIPEGEYTIEISKNGYKPGERKVYVNAGETSEFQLLLERIPAIVTADRDTLDFGKNYNTMSFNIVNNSYEDLTWNIEENCEWITQVNPKSDILKFGKTATIVIVIDREKLNGGTNHANIVLRSNNGSTEVKVIAEGEYKTLPSLETYEVTNIRAYSATLNGEIINSGSPEYTERGFVYSATTTEPTIENSIAPATSPKNSNAKFSCNIKNLALSQTYYVCAYAKNKNGISYGGIVEFTTTDGLPIVESLDEKNVTAQSVSLGGHLISNGGYKVYERGICWDAEGIPDIDSNHKYISGDKTGEYWIEVNGLKPNTEYYARAYAKNEIGISYGEIVEFTTNNGRPIVESLSTKEVTAKTASLGGRLVSNGGYKVDERGVCWDTDGTPDIADNHKYISGDETGEYWIDVNNLNPSTKYYARAYAKNENGVSYGNMYEFTTNGLKVAISIGNVTNVKSNSATLVASIDDAGSPAYTECGFCYSSSSQEPTIDNNFIKSSHRGVGQFTCSINGLDYNSTYYVRAYAIQNGEAIYSSPTNFRPTYSKASVTLNDVIDIEETTATFKATVTNVGDPRISEKGFCWSSSSSNPTIEMERKIYSGTSTSYKLEISNLNKCTTYYVRAYVIQDGEVIYSNTMNFTTISKPIVTTKAVTNLKFNGSWSLICSATFNGYVEDIGSPAYEERGFVYSTSSSPTFSNGTKVLVSGSGKIGSFSANVSEILTYQNYYVKAYVKTNNLYIYGETVSFSTY